MSNETMDQGSAEVAHNLATADHAEGLNTSTEHGGGEHAVPSALGLDPVAWVALSMAVFIGILLWKKVPAMLGKGLDSKIAEIRDQLDEAKKLRTEAEALRTEYAAKIASAEKDAAAMIEHADTEAKAIVEKAKVDAKDLIARRQKMAEDKIAAAERAAVDDVRAKAVTAATSAAGALIAQSHGASQDKSIVDKTIAGLGSVN